MKYDYLIVGAGLFGATFAQKATDAGKTVLVIELKRGQASDRVVGQIHRYMGYVKDEVLEKGQKLKGLIIGLKPDQGLKRALSMCPDIEFRRYEVDFKLVKD